MATILKKPIPDTDALWAINIQLQGEPLSDVSANIVFKAYNSTTGVIDHDHIETMQVTSAMALMDQTEDGQAVVVQVMTLLAANPGVVMNVAYAALVAAIKAEYERQNAPVEELL
jgi:hypothetical protein